MEDHLILCIPTKMHKKIFTHLHLFHQGITWTKQRACLTNHWPSIDNNAINMITACTSAKNTDHLTTRNCYKQKLGEYNSSTPSSRQLMIYATMLGEATYVVRVDCYLDWAINCSHTTANLLITVLMLLISLTLYDQQVLPCYEPVTTVK